METINKAITAIRKQTPWIGIVLQLLETVITDRIPTAATNGKQLLVNQQYAETLPFPHLMGVLVHEALHVIQRHMFRLKGRDQTRFNVACDHAINGIVQDLGYTLPANVLVRIDFQTAEQIYGDSEIEPDFGKREDGSESGESDESASGESEDGSDESESGSEDGSGSGESEDGSESSESGDGESGSGESVSASDPGDSDILEYPLEDGQTMADAEREVSDLLNRAQATARICGDIAGQVEQAVFEHVESSTDWNAELAEFITEAGAADYSLAPPNLILGSQGIIANRLNPSGLGHLVFVVDNSSSMDEDKLNQTISELAILVDNVDYETVRFIGCDTRVNFDRVFTRGEPIDPGAMSSGGGTKFIPAFEHVAEHCECDLMIYFTDMELSGYKSVEDIPDYPVIWAVYGNSLDDDLNWTMEDYDFFSPDWGHRVKIA